MKVIVITGASSGIGYEMANILSKKGHHVYGVSRTKVFEKDVFSAQADVRNFEQIKNLFENIYEQEERIDVLINNAGRGISGSIEDTEIEDVTQLMNVNFLGTFNTVKAVIPYMREQGYGKIINISSLASKFALPFQSFYSASKAAINSFSEALSIEVDPFGIQVCSVLPGDIKTGFSKNRKKNEIDHESYGKRVEKSVSLMENDEQNGMDAEEAAKTICKLVKKKHIPLYMTIGLKYKLFLFLSRFLPARVVNRLVGKVYGFKKG